jgi:hypothetical protein
MVPRRCPSDVVSSFEGLPSYLVSDNFSAFGMLPFRDLFSVYGAQLILPNKAAVAVDPAG